MDKRNIYLYNTPLEEAQRMFVERVQGSGIFNQTERIKVENSLGRVSSSAVFAAVSCPHYNASAMDGIAVKAASTFGAADKNGVLLEQNAQFIYVNTGEVIPEEFDAVIKIEEVIPKDGGRVLVMKSAVPWQHIRPIGEDIAAKELIIPSNHLISPVDIGAVLAGGVTEVEVYKQPKVGIIPTGTELVEPGSAMKKGNITDFNSRMFMGMVTEWGGISQRYPITRDDYESIKKAVKDAVSECDVVLVSAGSSAGSRDYTVSVIKELGEVIIHGIAAQPGKPAILGMIDNKPVVGVPGYPVSAYFVMNFFIKPLLHKLNRRALKTPPKMEAVTAKKIISSLKFEEYVRVKVGSVGGKLIASPLNRGAGVVMSLVRADGFMKVPVNCEGYEAGEKVEVTLMRDIEDILNTVVIIGSHDPVLDLLSDFLHRKYEKYSVSSTHVGSMGGIMALKRGETHMAGIHLLDREDGSYNRSYIRKYLKGRDIALLHLVNRTQGLMVSKGNPKNIKGFEDLVRDDIRFINRQKGSGTRMLLDYYLDKLGLSEDRINGYTREEFTHLTTASAIREGSADAALGIYSAAIAMDIEFIPVCEEQYDLAVPVSYLEQDNIKKVIDIISSEEFKNEVAKMGGYDLSQCGQIEYIEQEILS